MTSEQQSPETFHVDTRTGFSLLITSRPIVYSDTIKGCGTRAFLEEIELFVPGTDSRGAVLANRNHLRRELGCSNSLFLCRAAIYRETLSRETGLARSRLLEANSTRGDSVCLRKYLCSPSRSCNRARHNRAFTAEGLNSRTSAV